MTRSPPMLSVALFLATVGTTLLAGTQFASEGASLLDQLRAAAPFAAALLAILVTHELAHFVAARANRVAASPPYFIPMPVGGIGTLGAVINISAEIPSRRAVLDIGASGPVAGFLVALPLLFYGMATSPVVELPPMDPMTHLQSPFALVRAWLAGTFDPLAALRAISGPGVADGTAPAATAVVFGDSLITWLAVRLTHGALPPGHDVQLNAIAFAAWVGSFVTALNLLPVGQLDGGHVVYALFGRHAARVSKLFSWVLLGLGLFASWTWFFWWLLLRLLVGLGHPPPRSDEPLDPRRRAVAFACLALFAATFVPVPFRT